MTFDRGQNVAGALAMAAVFVLAGCGSRPTHPSADAAPDGPADAPAEGDAMDVAPADEPVSDAARADAARADIPFDAATGTAILAFCDEAARAFCALRRACGTYEPSESRCVTDRANPCRAEAVGALIPGVAAGRVRFDDEAAARWLAAVEASTCAYGFDPLPAFFHGLLANGSPCVDSRECEGGICDRATTCPGICASPSAVGGSCSPFGCDESNSWCRSDKCVPTRPPGTLCTPNTGSCGEGGYCAFRDLPCENETSCTCAAYRQAGENCRATQTCAAGLGCIAGMCRPPGQRGQSCDGEPRTGCAPGLVCVFDGSLRLCGDPVGEGGRCLDRECARGLFCVHSPANPTTTVGACRRPAALGQPCPDDWSCVEGTYCGEARTCVAGAKRGEPCLVRKRVPDVDVPGDDCSAAQNHCRDVKATCAGDGITCSSSDGGTCVVLPVLGEPCSRECAGDLRCQFEGDFASCRRAGRALGQPCGEDSHCASATCIRNVCAPPCTSADL